MERTSKASSAKQINEHHAVSTHCDLTDDGIEILWDGEGKSGFARNAVKDSWWIAIQDKMQCKSFVDQEHSKHHDWMGFKGELKGPCVNMVQWMAKGASFQKERGKQRTLERNELYR